MPSFWLSKQGHIQPLLDLGVLGRGHLGQFGKVCIGGPGRKEIRGPGKGSFVAYRGHRIFHSGLIRILSQTKWRHYSFNRCRSSRKEPMNALEVWRGISFREETANFYYEKSSTLLLWCIFPFFSPIRSSRRPSTLAVQTTVGPQASFILFCSFPSSQNRLLLNTPTWRTST